MVIVKTFPLTDPNEVVLIPLAGKPMLGHILDELLKLNISETILKNVLDERGLRIDCAIKITTIVKKASDPLSSLNLFEMDFKNKSFDESFL